MSQLDPIAIYRQEAAELLDSLEATLLDLGQAPDDRGLVDAAFRALHTIKGSGAMFGFDAVAAFTHDFETAFDRVRKGEVAVSEALVAVALVAKDHIRALIESPDAVAPDRSTAILADLQRLVSTDTTLAPPAEFPAQVAPDANAVAHGRPGWQIEIRFAASILRNGTDPLGLLDELRALGPCQVVADLDGLPDLEVLDPQDLHLGWSVTLMASCPRDAIDDVFIFVLDDMTLAVTPLGAGARADVEAEPVVGAPGVATVPQAAPVVVAVAPQSAIPATKREPGRRTDDKANESVRVQAERLDALMDRVGELVIAQARLSQFAQARRDPALTLVAEEIERLAGGLRDTTMGIRMVPIGTLFARFRRLVHDLSRDLGKPVEFVTVGEATELDKTMIERLADPLVHLIRNAIDHGVEAPAKRAASGKPATARIELVAEHVGAQVQITVLDDGAGLDTARIRAKAEEKGLIAPGAVLADAAVHDCLFQPGFSTADTVSALSGRGVGMDVVKRTIEGLRGSIEVSTRAGHGSSMALRLPLTLAIIDGLLIRVGEGRYIVPLSTVEECVELPPVTAGGNEAPSFLNIRGALVPTLHLRALFDATGEPAAHPKVIVTGVGDMRIGLVADAILGSHQTVIKSLSKLHADVAMFSGATILGDGTAALILDTSSMVTMRQASGSPAHLGRAA